MKNILLTIIPIALLLMVKPLSTHAQEIYWIKFKTDFERLTFTDVQELTNILKTPLLEKNIVLRTETYIKNSTRFFGTDLSFYTIISINDK